MKRILPLILTILLIPGLLAVPARADEITESGWMNLMDYGFLRGFDSHTGYLYDTGTYYYDLPSYYMTYGVRMVFSSTSPVDSVNFNYNGYIFPAVLEEIGDRLYVASVEVKSGISSIGFSFDFTQDSSSVSILDISVNFVGQAYSQNLLVNGKAWCGNQTCSFSSTVVNGLSGVAPDLDCEILLVPMEWKQFDFLTIYFEHEAFSISSISADLQYIPIPYEVDYLEASANNNEYRYAITLDLRGFDRSQDIYPNVRIHCRIANNDVTTFQIINSIGYVLVNSPSDNTFWFSALIDMISGGFSSVGSWISAQTNSIISSVSAWGQSLKNSIDALPDKIAEALKDLIVPSDSAIQDFGESSQQIAQDRFGGVYEGAMIVDSFAGQLQAQAATQILTVPVVNLNILGTLFPLGGWEVDLVPEGSEVIIEAVKLMIDILATLAFINGIKSRLERTLEQ